MAERSNAPVLKTGVPSGTVGSNPTPSAKPCYVYVLRNRLGRLYIGSTADPDERLKSHNAGRVRSTKAHRPWRRVRLEAHADRNAAVRRERYLKSGWGRRWLQGVTTDERRTGLAT